jgi:hypothetical protein
MWDLFFLISRPRPSGPLRKRFCLGVCRGGMTVEDSMEILGSQ